MDFELSEEQKAFKKMAKDFAEREIAPIAKEYDEQEKFPYEVVQKMAQVGLLGVIIPQEYGGLGLDLLTLVLILEELAYSSLGIAVAATLSGTLPATVVLKAGSKEQKQRYLPSICKGEKVFCVAAVEPNAGSDGGNIQTTAVMNDDQWTINGNKLFITNGTVSDTAFVLVQTDRSKSTKGLGIIAVDRNIPGFSVRKYTSKLGLRSCDLGDLRFDNCRVPKECLVGEIGKGLQNAMAGISNMRLSIAAYSNGISQYCLDTCIKYTQERQQFGKPIASFQLIQESIADMYVQIEASKYLCYSAAYDKEKGKPFNRKVSAAKYFAAETAIKVAAKAVKIHGAYGTVSDYAIERYYRDAVVLSIPGGTEEVHKLTIGRDLLGIDALSR